MGATGNGGKVCGPRTLLDLPEFGGVATGVLMSCVVTEPSSIGSEGPIVMAALEGCAPGPPEEAPGGADITTQLNQ